MMELAHNWADWTATRRHYELMARYVHPCFQGSSAPRVEAYGHAAIHFKDFTAEAAAAVNAEIAKQAARKGS
jgi:limonene 1,2-monooxygenase